jgi:N-acetylmuramic acid 6-phosphate etherase
MRFVKTTEQDSLYSDLEKKTVSQILTDINNEDQKVALAVQKALPQIEPIVELIVEKMSRGGRLFYIGAGTSGRLGILDASECPPTFGVPHDLVIGLIAGGDGAIRKAVEFAEDSTDQGWKDLLEYNITKDDVVIGIAASGTTPYVLGALQSCNENGIITGGIGCNFNSPLSQTARFPIEIIVGPEYVTGSSRMKAGTAQKMVLNMITTAVMIQLGRVKGNKMVDMQLSNNKLVNRGVQMLMTALEINESEASVLLEKYGSVRSSIEHYDDGRNQKNG